MKKNVQNLLGFLTLPMGLAIGGCGGAPVSEESQGPGGAPSSHQCSVEFRETDVYSNEAVSSCNQCGPDACCTEMSNAEADPLDVDAAKALCDCLSKNCATECSSHITIGCAIFGENGCATANDGECDSPEICYPGTDTADCAECPSEDDGICDEVSRCRVGSDSLDCSLPNSCEFADDGQCDGSASCIAGTDTNDCAGDSCIYALDGVCDDPPICDIGTDSTDCGASNCTDLGGTYSVTRTRDVFLPGTCPSDYPFNPDLPIKITTNASEPTLVEIEVGYSDENQATVFTKCSDVVVSSCRLTATCTPSGNVDVDELDITISGSELSGTLSRSHGDPTCTILFRLEGAL